MAIDCDIEPQLHIPHISQPYDDQKLMENFQAIQRWADRLHINCEGCDCEPEEGWTLTLGDNDSTYLDSYEYTFDTDATFSDLRLIGELTDLTSATVALLVNGVEEYSTVVEGSFDVTVDPGFTVAPGDTFKYVVTPFTDYAANYFSITHIQATGYVPSAGSGGGTDYDLHCDINADGVTLQSDQPATVSGPDTPLPESFLFDFDFGTPVDITFDDPAPPLTVHLHQDGNTAIGTFDLGGLSISGTQTGPLPLRLSVGILEDSYLDTPGPGPWTVNLTNTSPGVAIPEDGQEFPIDVLGPAVQLAHFVSLVATFSGAHSNDTMEWANIG